MTAKLGFALTAGLRSNELVGWVERSETHHRLRHERSEALIPDYVGAEAKVPAYLRAAHPPRWWSDACAGSPSQGMRRSEIGRYLCLGADVIGNQCIAPLMPQPMMGFAPLNPSYKLVGSEACRERETELRRHRRGNRRACGRRVPGPAGRKGHDLRAGETIPADRRRYSD